MGVKNKEDKQVIKDEIWREEKEEREKAEWAKEKDIEDQWESGHEPLQNSQEVFKNTQHVCFALAP